MYLAISPAIHAFCLDSRHVTQYMWTLRDQNFQMPAKSSFIVSATAQTNFIVLIGAAYLVLQSITFGDVNIP